MKPDEICKRIGANLLVFLNAKGVAPPYTEETINNLEAWRECCAFAMHLKQGKTVCLPGELGKLIPGGENLVKDSTTEEETCSEKV